MDYLTIKKKQNENIKKLLKNEPAHLKFILGKRKHSKGPHKIKIKGPKKNTLIRALSRALSKTRSKSKSIMGSKKRSKSKTRSKTNSIFKIFSSKTSKRGSKKRSKSINPLLTV